MRVKDTARMKAISDAELEKSGKKAKKKNSGFGIFVNSLGMILLAIMLVIVGVNFTRDSRIMQKSRLAANTNTKPTTAAVNSNNNDSEADAQDSSDTKSTSGGKQDKSSGSGNTKKTEAVEPTVTPEP